MAAKASEALMVNDEKRVLLALNDTDMMNTLATEVKLIVKELIKEGQFDIENEEHRAEVKRIGRRIGRTAKDINDCGVEYLRDTKAKIKLVEERKKWFQDELAIVRASVEKPVTEWESKREEADKAIAWLNLQKINSADMGMEQLQIVLKAILEQPQRVVPEKQDAYAEALQSTKDRILGRIEAVKLAVKQAEELEALRKEKAERDQIELDRLRKVVEKLPEAAYEGRVDAMPTPAAPDPVAAPAAPAEDRSDYIAELERLCIDLYNEFAKGDAHFDGEMKRLELIPSEDPF